MSAYLYTWNPKRWVWVDQADAVYRVNNGDQYDMYWSCGNTKKIQVGDVFFLMRLGVSALKSAPVFRPRQRPDFALVSQVNRRGPWARRSMRRR